MNSFILLVSLVFAFAVAGLPDKCKEPPKVSMEDCCSGFHDIMSEDYEKECGFEKIGNGPSCEPFTCVLKKYDILGPGNKMDKAKTKADLMKTFKDEWLSVTLDVSDKCLASLEKNKSDCEPRDYSICFIRKSFENCPKKFWKDTKECNDGKTYFTDCVKTD